jgi:hypothetical protein
MKRANEFMFLADLMLYVLRALEGGATVTKFVHEGSRAGSDVEFEVRLTKIGRDKLPRVTEKQTAKARK